MIPVVHGVDGFGELSAALLVDTTGVYPYPLKPSTVSKVAALPDLSIALTILLSTLSKILKRYLVVSPSMGQDGILGNLRIEKLLKLE